MSLDLKKSSFLALVFLLAGRLVAAEPPSPVSSVETLLVTWRDAARKRDVPVKIYYPSQGTAPAPGKFPVILFSHGLGGTREGYGYLGKAWAAQGFVSVHVQHPGSDDSAYKGTSEPLRKLKAALEDPDNQRNRPLDLRFALDQLASLADDPNFLLHGHLDLEKVGIAGHSFGAFTTMAIAGESYGPGTGDQFSMPDPRIKAAIAMSTPAPPARMVATAAFDGVTLPVFHLTGTEDTLELAWEGLATAAVNRRIAYDRTTHVAAYLLVFKGGDHLVFSGRPGNRLAEHDEEFRRLVVDSSVAFWNAYLKRDSAALTWLEAGGFAAELGTLGAFEQKHPAP